jgi:pimeloyl-ACP methyl ester carboxylesterase
MALELIEAGSTPVDLVGHSFGATVALRLALEHPGLVRSLTLIESVFFSAAKDANRPEFDTHMGAHLGFYDLLDKQDKIGAARAFSDIWGGQVPFDDLPQAQRIYMAERIEMIRAGGESLLGEGVDYIPLARVAQLTVPVLLIQGSKTDPIVAAVHASLDDVLPNSDRRIIEGGGHMVPISHPAEVANEMRIFFNL